MISLFKLIKSLGYTVTDQEEVMTFVWVNCKTKCNIFCYGSGTVFLVEDKPEVREFLHGYFYVQSKFLSLSK